MINTRQLDLRKLNSLTKYPSILTYHAINPKNGSLGEEILVPLDGDLIATEKVDGANTRIILLPDDMFIVGSREELLYARGDLIGNDEMGIVSATKSLAEKMLFASQRTTDGVLVVYAEVYGGDIGGSGKAARQYSKKKQFGHRMFDLAHFRPDQFLELLAWPLEKFSGWRERGGQPFVNEAELRNWAGTLGVELTPRIPVGPVPTGIDDVWDYLWNAFGPDGPATHCMIDDSGDGFPEGLVIRTADRSRIAKLRFEDYARTRRKRNP